MATSARALILAQRDEIDQLRQQLTALATEVASLREQLGCNSRNSSQPPSSDGPGAKLPARRKRSGRKRGGQQGHPGRGPELLPVERCHITDHHLEACRRCGSLLHGDDLEPYRHQVIKIPPIFPVVKEYRLHSLVCACCSTRSCTEQPLAYGDETGAPTGNADGGNPDRQRGWQWVMLTLW